MDLALAILPIFLLLAAGYGAAQTGLVPQHHWPAIEIFTYRLLIPVVLIEALLDADLSPTRIGPLAICLLLTFATMTALLLMLRRALPPGRLPNSRFTTIYQTSVRWNAFIAFAAADLIVGAASRSLVVVGIAVLIPTINIVAIVVLASFGPETRNARQVALTVARNPMVLGSAIGLALNLLALPIPAPVRDTLAAIGDGSLGIGLLVLGAGVSLRRLVSLTPALWTAVAARQLLSPALFILFALPFGLTPDQLFIGALIVSVPAATNGYIVAKQMGGDASLYADVMTWQVVVSMVAIPLLAAALL